MLLLGFHRAARRKLPPEEWEEESMRFFRKSDALAFVCAFLILGIPGCSSNQQDQQERDAKTRDEVAKATEEAGKKVGQAAESAAQEARAAAQGVRDGWKNSQSQHPPVDLNSATERELRDLPGITPPDARKIIAGRPYSDPHDLLSKGILSDTEYQRIRDRTTVK
jgi:DNA uptake protein ComE-like DNA-binding protein